MTKGKVTNNDLKKVYTEIQRLINGHEPRQKIKPVVNAVATMDLKLCIKHTGNQHYILI